MVHHVAVRQSGRGRVTRTTGMADGGIDMNAKPSEELSVQEIFGIIRRLNDRFTQPSG